MNILPTGPAAEGDSTWNERYFSDLRRWNFDIAYNSFYAMPMRLVVGEYAGSYRSFAERAAKEGVPACVQIQSVVANSEDVPLTETQRYSDNTFHLYEHFQGMGKVFHFASFASRPWLEFLKKLTGVFRDFGYDWVVYEEPMLHTDIPGQDDPIRARFKEVHPNLQFPTRQSETPEYLALQALKRDTLVGFYDELTSYARSIGFTKIGLMPWFFTPTFENTPPETWNTCCDTGRLTHLKNMDFIVVRMQPDNIYAQAMIAATGESTPTLAYYECLAHQLGKPIIMVNNPTDEHRPERHRESSLIPYPFFQRYTLSVAAACPQGMSRHWYGKNYGEDLEHMALMTQVNDVLRRLSPPASEIAFVYSHAGASHVWPKPWRETWRAYWTFARNMVEKHRMPFLTFFAETLRESLEKHPETRIVVLNENFPIPPEETEFLEEWVSGDAARHLVYFGGRDGYRWSHDTLHTHYTMRPPEMARLFGINIDKPVEPIYGDSTCVLEVTADNAQPVFGDMMRVSASCLCRPALTVNAEAVYVAGENRAPVIVRRRYKGGGDAWFVGLPLEANRLDFPFRTLFSALLGQVSQLPGSASVIDQAEGDVFFNVTQNGYLVVANCGTGQASVRLDETRYVYDVQERTRGDVRKINLEPLSLKVMRFISDQTLLYDVRNAIYIMKIVEGDKSVNVHGMFHGAAELVLSRHPAGIEFSGQPLAWETSQETRDGVWVKLSGIPLRDGDLSIRF